MAFQFGHLASTQQTVGEVSWMNGTLENVGKGLEVNDITAGLVGPAAWCVCVLSICLHGGDSSLNVHWVASLWCRSCCFMSWQIWSGLPSCLFAGLLRKCHWCLLWWCVFTCCQRFPNTFSVAFTEWPQWVCVCAEARMTNDATEYLVRKDTLCVKKNKTQHYKRLTSVTK